MDCSGPLRSMRANLGKLRKAVLQAEEVNRKSGKANATQHDPTSMTLTKTTAKSPAIMTVQELLAESKDLVRRSQWSIDFRNNGPPSVGQQVTVPKLRAKVQGAQTVMPLTTVTVKSPATVAFAAPRPNAHKAAGLYRYTRQSGKALWKVE